MSTTYPAQLFLVMVFYFFTQIRQPNICAIALDWILFSILTCTSAFWALRNCDAFAESPERLVPAELSQPRYPSAFRFHLAVL